MPQPPAPGHTLPELLTVLAILGILMGIALPAFTDAMARRRLEAAGEALVASLERARGAAIRRGHHVWVCASHDGRSCSARPAWHRGWLARDHERRTIFDLSDHLDSRLRSRERAGRPDVRFQPDGGSEGRNQTITLCLRAKPLSAFNILVSNAGRIRRDRASMSEATACASAPR